MSKTETETRTKTTTCIDIKVKSGIKDERIANMARMHIDRIVQKVIPVITEEVINLFSALEEALLEGEGEA